MVVPDLTQNEPTMWSKYSEYVGKCDPAGAHDQSKRSGSQPAPPGKRARPKPTARTLRARYRTGPAGRGRRTCELPRFGAPAHPRRAGAALAALPAARPVKGLAAVRREPARGPLKANPTRRWAYSSRPSRLTKFRGAQPSRCLCCVTANVRLVPHHAGQLEPAGHGQGRGVRAAAADFVGFWQ